MTNQLVIDPSKSLNPATEAGVPVPQGCVYLIDDDAAIRRLVTAVLSAQNIRVQGFESGKAFLDSYVGDQTGCLLLDVDLPEMSGVDIQQNLKERNIHLPVIFLTGVADVDTSVVVMKRGAFDLIQKPFDKDRLLAVVGQALAHDAKQSTIRKRQMQARGCYQTLNSREREVMGMVVAGMANKQIARQLDLSEKTIEVHRSRAMTKMGADSLAELVRMSLDVGIDAGTASRNAAV